MSKKERTIRVTSILRQVSQVVAFTLVLGGLTMLPTGTAAADTIAVPGDYSTIQQAIDAAIDGDTIVVAAGVYSERIDFLGKEITVESSSGSLVTAIDGGGIGPVVTMAFDDDSTAAVLRGFTIQNGTNDSWGGGIFIDEGAPLVESNIVQNNTAWDGAGIAAIKSSAVIKDNIVRDNSTFDGQVNEGGGIYIGGVGHVEVLSNTIRDNFAADGGGISVYASDVLISGNSIIDNQATSEAGGILTQRPTTIVNNYIIGNEVLVDLASKRGTAIVWQGGDLINNTIVGNPVSRSSLLYVATSDEEARIANNVVYASTLQDAIECGGLNKPVAPIFEHNNVYAPYTDLYIGLCQDMTGIDGNISLHPGLGGPADIEYNNRPNSPQIDAGTSVGAPATDAEGDPRPVDGNGDGIASWDIGADEAETPATVVTGRVIDQATGNPVADACVSAHDTLGYHDARVVTSASGTYGIALEPGTTRIFFYDCRSVGVVEEWFEDATDFDGATPVSVVEGETTHVADAAVTLNSHPITIRTESLLGNPLGQICVRMSTGGLNWAGTTDGSGVVAFEAPSATYALSVGIPGATCRTGYEPEQMDITVGGPHQVTVQLGLERSTFSDTADSIFGDSIDWLAGAGVTKGCNPPVNDRFCPDEVVTRGQMAAFLVRAFGLSGSYAPGFIDDDDSVFEADIEKLAAAGVTKGCNPPVNDRFCPGDPVSRGQMAAFLHRAFGSDLTPGAPVTFTDDDTSIFEDSIEWLGAVGVTSGCNPPANTRFCPDAPVTRGQMAAFLARAFSG
ncbi:MAG: hypothetical protein GY788_09095 [bacterium]|nr:hypothetical protein [bacterium]